jgi:hypothetical protein
LADALALADVLLNEHMVDLAGASQRERHRCPGAVGGRQGIADTAA